MRFVLGTLLGFGAGLAGAILFAPEKKKPAPDWLPAQARASMAEKSATNGSTPETGLKGIASSVKKRIDEAMTEAREAQQAAEREAQDRYERSVGKR